MATLTADKISNSYGCSNPGSDQDNCSSSTVLTDDEFDYEGTTYTVSILYWASGSNLLVIGFSGITGQEAKTALGSLTLNVDGTALAVSGSISGSTTIYWDYDPATDWTDGQTVSLSLTAPGTTPPPTMPDPPPAAPSAPVIEVTPGPGKLTVRWECKEDVEGQGAGRYVLEWKLSSDEMYPASNRNLIGCTAGTKNTFIIDGLLPETNYEVRVTANVQGSSQDFKGLPPYSEKTVRTRGARTPDPVVRTPGGGGGGAPSPPPPPPPPSPDRAPLLALYQTAGGGSWENKWDTDFPVDDWHGVRTNEDNRVTELDLSDNGLSGEIEEIAEEIGKLSYLETLDLSGNPDLTGELPSDLMELEKLETLDTQNTGLCAPLDEEFQDWLMGITFRGENCAEETEDEPQVSGGGGCAMSSLEETGDGAISGVLGLFLVSLLVFAALGRRRARG